MVFMKILPYYNRNASGNFRMHALQDNVEDKSHKELL